MPFQCNRILTLHHPKDERKLLGALRVTSPAGDFEQHRAWQRLCAVPWVERPRFRLEISRGFFCHRPIPLAAPSLDFPPCPPPSSPAGSHTLSFAWLPALRSVSYPRGETTLVRGFGVDHPARPILALCYFVLVFLRRRLWVFHPHSLARYFFIHRGYIFLSFHPCLKSL